MKILITTLSLIVTTTSFAKTCIEPKGDFKAYPKGKDKSIYYQVKRDGKDRELLLCKNESTCISVYKNDSYEKILGYLDKKMENSDFLEKSVFGTSIGTLATSLWGITTFKDSFKAKKLSSITLGITLALGATTYALIGRTVQETKISDVMELLDKNSCNEDIELKMDTEDFKATASYIMNEENKKYSLTGNFLSTLIGRVGSSKKRAGEMDERFAQVEKINNQNRLSRPVSNKKLTEYEIEVLGPERFLYGSTR